jgi:hypothetical protein
MAVHEPMKTVDAIVRLRVPRGTIGDLPSGARDVLAKVDAVRSVDVGEIRDVRPTSFDIHVEVAARLDVAGDDSGDPDGLREALLDGFGIEAVDALTVDYG